MGVTKRFAAAWAEWPLLYRILLAQGTLLVVGAVLFVAAIMLQHRAEAIADEQDRGRLLLLIATPLVAEHAVTGDVAAAHQLLERQATAYPDVSRLVWRAPGRDDVGAVTSRLAETTPGWFRRMVNIATVTRSAEISLGGVNYGELEVILAPGRVEFDLWNDFVRYVWLSVGTATVLFVALMLMLRAPLRALHDLGAGAERFGRGDYGTRVEPRGALETRNVALAFNSMAERMQDMVTQLLDGRRQLREQLHFTEALIEALPVPMYYKDPKGDYLSVNRAWEALFGIPREEIIGRTLRSLYAHAPQAMTYHEKMDHALLANRGVQSYEIPIPTHDGREIDALYSKATMTDADGHVIGLIGIITDLTDLKQAERQVRDALLQKASAEQASEAKSMFLANMSHEIRTPLTAIIGFSEALLDVNQSIAERIEGIRTINRAGKHLLGIISDILDLSKIEAGRLEVECLPVPVLQLVEDIVAIARPQAEAKGLAFRVAHEFPLPWTIHSDSVRMKQILFNLVGNAIKFTEQGSVTMCLRHDADNALLVIEVQDTGIGISPEQIGRLFQPFSQADAATTRRFGGTGLGLALSKQLAEKLGGTIVAASVPGQGSRFFATLATGSVGTLIHSAAEAQANIHGAAAEGGVTRLSGSVLLAEDNADNQRLVALNTRRFGATLDIVENGAEAVAAALAKPYDLVLMDMQMPVMDGLTAVRTLRARGYAGPIVALTANATPQDMASGIGAGCDDFLTKPIERRRFGEVLRRFLHASAAAPGASPAADKPAMPVPVVIGPEEMRYFAGRLQNDVAILRQVVANGDLEAVGGKARELRAAAGRYSCLPLGDMAGQLEFAARSGNAGTAEVLIGNIGQLAGDMVARLSAPGGAPEPIVSELLAEGPDMVELVEYFLGRLPGYLQNLQDALAASNLAAIKKQAHDLKGVGGGYGYPQVTALAIRIEAVAGEGRLEEIALLIKAFAALARRIEAGAGKVVDQPDNH